MMEENPLLPSPVRDMDSLVPRPYQEQLTERSLTRNTIINLPTGSGKTHIAIMLIKKMKKDLSIPWNAGGKRCVFLVNNVPLVDQQQAVINAQAPVKAGGFSSENKVDLWKKDKWEKEIAKYQVLVMTGQILANMLQHDFIRLRNINLIIFDECHHAVEDHPMRQIMKMFEACPVDEQPRVLGLTATLLNGNVKLNNVAMTIKDLETTFHATIATVNNMCEVLDFCTNPYEVIITHRIAATSRAADEAFAILDFLTKSVDGVKIMDVEKVIPLGTGQLDITKDYKYMNKKVANMIADTQKQIKALGLFGGSLATLAYIIALERIRRSSKNHNESIFFKFIITHLHRVHALLEQAMSDVTGYNKILKYSTDHIHKLIDVLHEFDKEVFESDRNLKINKFKQPLSAIIFVRQRFTAKILYNILKEAKKFNPQQFSFLRHDFIVGFNINPFNNTREQLYEKKMSQGSLLKFRKGEINCLISTSVIEEGVDIPKCSLVILYDPPLQYRSYIQSKGRARSKTSAYVMLVDETEHIKFRTKYTDFQNCERHIQDLLVGKERADPSLEQIEDELYSDTELQPFILLSGARITETSAISLLNQYCSILPQDLFTIITPNWILNNCPDGKKQITIYMPINCPIKEPIMGIKMKNLKAAKRSAALEVCKKLYEAGELNPYSALPKKYAAVDFEQHNVQEMFLNWEEEPILNVQGLPGTKKRLRKHKKIYPKCLEGPGLWKFGKKTFHLHIITMNVVFKKPTDSRDMALYELLLMKSGYAILTPKPLPKLCDFPLFLNVGEVRIRLEVNYKVSAFSCDKFDSIKEFHLLIFDQVLGVAKKFVAFEGLTNAAYVVPVKCERGGTYLIDWHVIDTYKHIAPVVPPHLHDRSQLKVTQEYKYAVVTPWYRGTILPDRYIVSNILEDKSSKSSFDKENCGTYEDYYSSKYNISVVGDPNQPLLEVKQINSRLNCLLPRAATLNTLTGKQLRLASAAQGEEKLVSFKECLVAEFCIKYDFPGVLWYKATVLPSVLHRIMMLLAADELRVEIAEATGLGSVTLQQNMEWKPLTVDVKISTESLLGYCDAGTQDGSLARSLDRINGRGNLDNAVAPLPNPVRITTMKDSLFRLQLKKLGKQYPWDENKEPMDIERNLTDATLMDIECYDEFMKTEVTPAEIERSPKRRVDTKNSSAICPPPVKYNDKINLLSRKQTQRGVELRDLLTALTVIKAHDTFNMERTETLGDSFLKFASTLYLFHKLPNFNEGQLTNIKGRLIGNRNLYYAGRRVKLGGRIKVEGFSPRNDFIVPGFSVPPPILELITRASIRPTFLIGVELLREEQLSGHVAGTTLEAVRRRYLDRDGGLVEAEMPNNIQLPMQIYLHTPAVPDKVIADCVESLVGVYLIGCGLLGGVRILEWLRVLPAVDKFETYLTRRVSTAITEKRAKESDVDFLLNYNRREVEDIIGYTFRDPALLLEALSHPSYSQNRLTRSYERLEFLGDAILDFLITAHLFEREQDLKPGQLTDLRSALVNNVTFAGYVVKLGLHKYMMSQINPALERTVMTFVEHQEQRKHEISEDVLYLIDEADCKLSQYVEVPKVLSDLFESLAGAIFLDSSGDLECVWKVYYSIMQKEIEVFCNDVPIQPVRQLYERIHACPQFGTVRPVSADVPEYMAPVTVTVNGQVLTVYGFGCNRRQAQRAAAKLALKNLG